MNYLEKDLIPIVFGTIPKTEKLLHYLIGRERLEVEYIAGCYSSIGVGLARISPKINT